MDNMQVDYQDFQGPDAPVGKETMELSSDDEHTAKAVKQELIDKVRSRAPRGPRIKATAVGLESERGSSKQGKSAAPSSSMAPSIPNRTVQYRRVQ